MAFNITAQCRRANMLPTWRTLHLNHINQLRMMIRSNHPQAGEARRLLKDAQRSAAKARQAWFKAGAEVSMSFEDGRTFTIGDTVYVSTKYGTDGLGEVIGFNHQAGRVKIALDPAQTEYGMLDRWELFEEGESIGFYDRARDQGLHGGEIEQIIKKEAA